MVIIIAEDPEVRKTFFGKGDSPLSGGVSDSDKTLNFRSLVEYRFGMGLSNGYCEKHDEFL